MGVLGFSYNNVFDNRSEQNTFRYQDTAQLDAFGRLRTSSPYTLSDNKFLFDKQPLFWDEKLIISGTVSSEWRGDSVIYMFPQYPGDKIIRQSKKYHQYQPGKSFLVMCSGVMNDRGGEEGIRSRMGYFDDAADKVVSSGSPRGNGIFLELDGLDAYIVKRDTIQNVGQTDTRVHQSEWNVDIFSGNGGHQNPSEITIGWSKAQLFFMDLEWLGVGRVRVGFNIDGQNYFAHEFNHANIESTTYMDSANLPIRYEIENISGGTDKSAMLQICSTAVSEGGYENLGKPISISSNEGIFKTLTSTLSPVLTVRLKEQYNRAELKAINLNTINNTVNRAVYWQLLLNANLTGTSYVGVNSSIAEYDRSATLYSGGYAISSGWLTARDTSINIPPSTLAIMSNISGRSDTLTLVARTDSATADFGASIGFQEFF